MKKLSILIPYTKDRELMVVSLKNELMFSCPANMLDEIEILTDPREQPTSVGTKRNSLLERATGEYVAFFDSDDKPCNNYIELLLEGIDKGADCCSLKGIMTTDDKNPEIFEHSIKYDKYETIESAKEGEVKYLRFPNHLNCIKASIAKKFKFPETNWSEDTNWATQIHKSGLIKTEHYIPDVLYYYLYKNKK